VQTLTAEVTNGPVLGRNRRLPAASGVIIQEPSSSIDSAGRPIISRHLQDAVQSLNAAVQALNESPEGDRLSRPPQSTSRGDFDSLRIDTSPRDLIVAAISGRDCCLRIGRLLRFRAILPRCNLGE
jgi:hypothetical protein